ncbi:MAG TPA: DUF6174 domain-containing protein [Lacipirellulaceae bacterium]
MKSPRLSARGPIGSLLLTALVAAFLTPAATALALDQPELDANRALWDSHNITNYDFQAQVECFCPPDLVRPAVVSVRMDSIASVVDAQTFEPRNPADYLTIDAMFDRLQQALNSDDLVIDAQFDSTLGHPSFFRIDEPILADDEYSWTVEKLTVVLEPGGLALGLVAFAVLAGALRVHPRRAADAASIGIAIGTRRSMRLRHGWSGWHSTSSSSSI